jgi:hypothetical protein
MFSLLRVFSIAGILLLTFCVGCSKYESERDVVEVSGLSTGELAPLEGSFDYYKEDALRFDAYVIYLKDRTFFDLNESEVSVILKDIKVEPGASRDMTIHFEKSPYSLPFDYSLAYDYIQLNTGDSLVEIDGLINEDHGIYMVRIMNFKTEG